MKYVKNSTLALSLVLSLTACGGGSSGDTQYVPTNVVDQNLSGDSNTTIPKTNDKLDLKGSMSLVGSLGANNNNATNAKAIVTLLVDANKNGSFNDTQDLKYTSNVDDKGFYEFPQVSISDVNSTDIYLTASKENFVPSTQKISVRNTQSINVLTEAGKVPLINEVVKVDRNITDGNISFGKSGMSLPIASIPSGVTTLHVTSKVFDATKSDEASFIPQAKNNLQIASYGTFDLKDQNGNEVTLLKPEKRSVSRAVSGIIVASGMIDYRNCIRTELRNVEKAQVDLIEANGDYNTSTTQFEVPMWNHNDNNNTWEYIGVAEYVDANKTASKVAQFKMCITENWAKNVAIGYLIPVTKPKNMCLNAEYDDGAPMDSFRFKHSLNNGKDTVTYPFHGHAVIELLDANASIFDYQYEGDMTSGRWVDINKSIITKSNTPSCDYDMNITIKDPYSSTLEITTNGLDGSNGSDYVNIIDYSNSDWYTRYNRYVRIVSGDKQTIRIKSEKNYNVSYRGFSTVVNANNKVENNETLDADRYVKVTLKEQQVAPTGWIGAKDYIKPADSEYNLRLYVRDDNGDAVKVDSVSLDATPIEDGSGYYVEHSTQRDGSLDASVVVNVKSIDDVNQHTIQFIVSDSFGNIGKITQGFVKTPNTAPDIYHLDIYDNARKVYRTNHEVRVGNHSIDASSHDLHGDAYTLTYLLDSNDISNRNNVYFSDGNHTITVKATETSTNPPLSSTYTYNVVAGDLPPAILQSGANPDVVNILDKNNTIYVIANDEEDDESNGKGSLKVTATDQNGTLYEFIYNNANNQYLAVISAAKKGRHIYDVVVKDSADNNDTQKVVVDFVDLNVSALTAKIAGKTLYTRSKGSQALESWAMSVKLDSVSIESDTGPIKYSIKKVDNVTLELTHESTTTKLKFVDSTDDYVLVKINGSVEQRVYFDKNKASLFFF